MQAGSRSDPSRAPSAWRSGTNAFALKKLSALVPVSMVGRRFRSSEKPPWPVDHEWRSDALTLAVLIRKPLTYPKISRTKYANVSPIAMLPQINLIPPFNLTPASHVGLHVADLAKS